MALLTEQNIIDNAYYLLEKSSELWDTSTDEYLTARGLANIAINRWERYDQVKWKELITPYGDASGVTTTTTAGTYTYNAPSNTVYTPASFVRTVGAGGQITTWAVITAKERMLYAPTDRVCWFDGNPKAGFVLNFNSGVQLTTGETIDYDYYRAATRLASTTGTTEVPDPDFLSYYIAAHMAEEGVDPDLNNMAESRLEDMRVANMSSPFAVADNIPNSQDIHGFGL